MSKSNVKIVFLQNRHPGVQLMELFQCNVFYEWDLIGASHTHFKAVNWQFECNNFNNFNFNSSKSVSHSLLLFLGLSWLSSRLLYHTWMLFKYLFMLVSKPSVPDFSLSLNTDDKCSRERTVKLLQAYFVALLQHTDQLAINVNTTALIPQPCLFTSPLLWMFRGLRWR